MLRHIAIALTAAVIICATASSVAARGGSGGHMGGGNMGGGHMGAGWGGGNLAVSHAGNFGSFSHANVGAFSHPFAFHGGNHFVGRRFAFRHRFHRRFFFFVGAPYAFAYDDGCYVRIWTHWGWRWRNVCY